MSNRIRRRQVFAYAAISALTAGVAAGTPTMAQAQTSASAVDEVVVTARRREENLLQVPVAISAVSGAALEKAAISNPQDLTRVVPGFISGAGSTRGFNQLVLTIRGMRNGEPAITADQSIGVYFAEVPQNAPQGLNQAFFDLSSVQVLKGPQGTLFGRNATGGALLIEPNLPGPEFGGYVKGSLGDYDLRDIEAVLNVPLGERAGLRLAGKRVRRDGYLNNVLNGLKYNDINRLALRGSLRFELSDAVETVTIASYNRSDTQGEGYKLDKISSRASATPALGPAFLETWRLRAYDFMNSTLPTTPGGIPTAYDRTWSLQNTTRFDLGDGGFLGDAQIKNIIGVRDVLDRAYSDASGTRVPTQLSLVTDDLREFSEELQLSGKTGNLDYVAGLYYFQSRGSESIGSYNNGINLLRFSDLDANNTSYSGYAHIDYALNSMLDGLSLSLGGRVTHDKRETIRYGRDQTALGSTIFRCQLQTTVTGANSRDLCNVKLQVSFTKPTWETSLNWQATPDNLLYASYRRGYRTGGFSSSATTLLIATTPYRPERLDTYEIGSKNAFSADNMSGSLTLAAYYSDYRDVQRRTNVLTGLNQTQNYTFNAAKAHLYGGEAELHLRLFENLKLDASYARIIYKYDRWINKVVVLGATYDHDISSSRPNDISKNQVSLSATYDLPLDGNGVLSFNANYSYRSSFTTQNEVNPTNCIITGAPTTNNANISPDCLNRAGIIPGYDLINTRVTWENVLGKGFDASVFVNNVTNNFYYANGITALSTLGIFAVGIGPPRMWGVELRVPFGGMRN